MVKSELVEKIADRAGITQYKAEEIVELFFDAITECLCRGDRVEIRGFGALTVKDYRGYTGRNPKTGALVEVRPKRLPVWRTGTELRHRVEAEKLVG